MNLTKEQYREIYKKLPQYRREIIGFPETDNVIDNILLLSGKEGEKRSRLAYIFKDALYGVNDIHQIFDRMKEEVNLDEMTAKKLTDEFNTKIFSDLEGYYRKILETTQKEEEARGNEFHAEEYFKEVIDSPVSAAKISQITNNKEIRDRVNAISLKYELDEDQKDKIFEIILLVLSKPDEEPHMATRIAETLSISSLVAEQIAEELSRRVIEYASQLSTRPEKSAVSPISSPQRTVADEFAHTEPSIPRKEIDVPMYITSNNSITKEPVQKPLNVPRFTSTPTTGTFTKPVDIPKKVETLNIIESKLNKVTPGLTDKVGEEPQMPSTKYTADPYREPLE